MANCHPSIGCSSPAITIFHMRLLSVSLLILNLLFSAWSLEKRLSGHLRHGVWIVICLATTVLCFLELGHQVNNSLKLPALGSPKAFLEKSQTLLVIGER